MVSALTRALSVSLRSSSTARLHGQINPQEKLVVWETELNQDVKARGRADNMHTMSEGSVPV